MQLKQQVGRRHQAFQGSRGVVRRPTSIVCQASGNEQQSRRQVIGTLVNLGASLVAAPAMADAFLSSTGAR